MSRRALLLALMATLAACGRKGSVTPPRDEPESDD